MGNTYKVNNLTCIFRQITSIFVTREDNFFSYLKLHAKVKCLFIYYLLVTFTCQILSFRAKQQAGRHTFVVHLTAVLKQTLLGFESLTSRSVYGFINS